MAIYACSTGTGGIRRLLKQRRMMRGFALAIVLPALAALLSMGNDGCRINLAGHVGKDVCLSCHNGILAPDQSAFPISVHRTLECEACHGSGLSHVRNGGRGGLFIRNPARDAFPKHHQLCEACHPTQTLQYLASGHATSLSVRCTDCHDVHAHAPTRLEFQDNSLCLHCHADMHFPSEAAIEAHTFHSNDAAGTGASRCTACHMLPLDRTLQAAGPHLHAMIPLSPQTTLDAIAAGVSPAPVNSCAGTAGCHDGTVITAPTFDVDNPRHNELLQILFEERYGGAPLDR